MDLETIHRLQKMFVVFDSDKLNKYKISRENLGVYNLQKLSDFLQNYNFAFL
jgi:hypothetical protein